MQNPGLMRVLPLLRRLGLNRLFFTLMYWRGRPPWDSGIVPPEIVALVEGSDALPPGRALDLGCGTGTSSLYLARHGWQVTGIDFTEPAVVRARAKARAEGVAPERARFLQGDVTRLDALPLGEPYSLIYDVGCLHGVPVSERPRYVAGVARAAAPGATYMLYAFEHRASPGPAALPEADVRALFTPAFTIVRVEHGSDRGAQPSAWYWLRKVEQQ